MLCLFWRSGCGAGQNSVSAWQEQYDLGIRYLSEGNYEEAIIAFTAAIEIDSNRAEAYVGRGDAYIGSGETEENLFAAQADYEEAIRLDETNADAWLGLADIYIRRGEYDCALEILQEGLEQSGAQEITDKITEIEGGTYTDSMGNLRRRNGYDARTGESWYQIFSYDELSRETGVTGYDASGNQVNHADVVYDENGNRIRDYRLYSSSVDLFPTVCEYDENGNLIRENTYQSGDGTLTLYWTYEYDEAGNMVVQDLYSSDNVLTAHTTFEYDNNGNMIQDNVYVDGELVEYHIYEYDSNGRVVYDQLYMDGIANTYRTYEYEGNTYSMSEYAADGTLVGTSTGQLRE